MRVLHTVSTGMVVGLAMVGTAQAAPDVVASIKPIHGLVAAVMGDVGSPELLVDGAGSPHNYALRPSQASSVQDADIVFWVGHSLEQFLEKALETIGENAQSVALSEIDGIKTLEYRDIKLAEKDTDDHEGHDHDGHDHDDHKEEASAEHDHGQDHDHADGGIDPHIWLDTDNARVMVQHIANVLSAADSDNADTYAGNAAAFIAQLDVLNAEIEQELKPYRERQFVVFHDAYHYFEDRFGLEATAAITVSPETPPSAQRVRDMQTVLAENNVTCVFDEPQFEPRIITTIVEGTDINRATLDPLGVNIAEGADFYPALIRSLSTSFTQCFAATQ
ncbi:MAG: zinc ABC transporter substrate-binding protein [Ahrensia sp.]